MINKIMNNIHFVFIMAKLSIWLIRFKNQFFFNIFIKYTSLNFINDYEFKKKKKSFLLKIDFKNFLL